MKLKFFEIFQKKNSNSKVERNFSFLKIFVKRKTKIIKKLSDKTPNRWSP
jgi:hypothetical protein